MEQKAGKLLASTSLEKLLTYIQQHYFQPLNYSDTTKQQHK
jgi:hypothetical protein